MVAVHAEPAAQAVAGGVVPGGARFVRPGARRLADDDQPGGGGDAKHRQRAERQMGWRRWCRRGLRRRVFRARLGQHVGGRRAWRMQKRPPRQSRQADQNGTTKRKLKKSPATSFWVWNITVVLGEHDDFRERIADQRPGAEIGDFAIPERGARSGCPRSTGLPDASRARTSICRSFS